MKNSLSLFETFKVEEDFQLKGSSKDLIKLLNILLMFAFNVQDKQSISNILKIRVSKIICQNTLIIFYNIRKYPPFKKVNQTINLYPYIYIEFDTCLYL